MELKLFNSNTGFSVFTDPLGLHLGNPLGLLLCSSLWSQSDFVCYPVLNGHATSSGWSTMQL